MTEQKKKTPNSGSDEAIKVGCLCAFLDNRYGLGAFDGVEGTFLISDNCPIHGKLSQKGKKGG